MFQTPLPRPVKTAMPTLEKSKQGIQVWAVLSMSREWRKNASFVVLFWHQVLCSLEGEQLSQRPSKLNKYATYSIGEEEETEKTEEVLTN